MLLATITIPRISRTPQGVRGLKLSVGDGKIAGAVSHPARGAWIEISRVMVLLPPPLSHPARGAWIEIPAGGARACMPSQSHPARGAWIEIAPHPQDPRRGAGRTPQGVRGLKLAVGDGQIAGAVVAPRKGCVD